MPATHHDGLACDLQEHGAVERLSEHRRLLAGRGPPLGETLIAFA
jgi:hypothetical protein